MSHQVSYKKCLEYLVDSTSAQHLAVCTNCTSDG